MTTTDSGPFDIDRVVELAEARDPGGYAGAPPPSRPTPTTKATLLLAVVASSNRGKGDQDPGERLPLPLPERAATSASDLR